MPRMWTPLLSSSTHRRISPGLYLVGAACRTMVLDCSEGGAGRGAGRGFGFGTGIAFAPVAGSFLGGGGVAGGGCLFVDTGVVLAEVAVAFAGADEFGPVVGCLPLSFLVES